MSASVFLVDPEFVSDAALESILELPKAVSHHMSVMRIEPNEVCELVDGQGKRITGNLNIAGQFVVRNIAVEALPGLRIDVAQALIKGDRLENSLDMLTQVGVMGMIPWIADHSVVKWQGDKVAKQFTKWTNITRAATEQSRRSWTPEIRDPVTSAELANRLSTYDHVIVLVEASGDRYSGVTSGSVLLIVGPEGGISARERELFGEAESLTVGAGVFRSETAGVVGASYLFTKSGEWDSESGDTMQGLSNA